MSNHPLDTELLPSPAVADDAKPAQASTFSRSFKDVMAALTSKASEGGAPKKIRRRLATIVVDHSLCEPGVYDEDFKVTIEGLDSNAELDAIKSAENGAAVGHAMVKRAIRSFNGTPLKGHERDALWETLGMAGRLLLVDAYMKYCSGVGDGASLGKSLGVEIG